MSILKNTGLYRQFDEQDVHLLQEMLKKFSELHAGTGTPDFSTNYASYLPVFAVALLGSQESVERLTKRLLLLTLVLVGLTVVLAILTAVMLVRAQ